MKMKPILFSTLMVQAILEDRKTKTRRMVPTRTAPEGRKDSRMVFEDGEWWEIVPMYCLNDGNRVLLPNSGAYEKQRPRYQPGDILRVRETTYLYGRWAKNGLTKKGKQKYKFVWNSLMPVFYAATSKPDAVCTRKDQVGYFKRPSIFVPRTAARIFLRVTDVQVERVQDISPADVVREGAYDDCRECLDSYGNSGAQCCYRTSDECSQADSAVDAFARLWDSLNAKRGFGWATNPWVWVYTFERCEEPVDE